MAKTVKHCQINVFFRNKGFLHHYVPQGGTKVLSMKTLLTFH